MLSSTALTVSVQLSTSAEHMLAKSSGLASTRALSSSHSHFQQMPHNTQAVEIYSTSLEKRKTQKSDTSCPANLSFLLFSSDQISAMIVVCNYNPGEDRGQQASRLAAGRK